ncbi:SRPBCC family protein [Actinomycetospora endophytica]|uniref:SRPBCC family protein n=1 Tax=Actinomycetospora endophytica TaxID=2291215 RepID=A0ABS8P818_9PSEU|nr:SRPBCC family protein [Actinomycetospora endophytica]MCD2194158.1 SRPBCC family protein [Actinomycetospora endophytica]
MSPTPDEVAARVAGDGIVPDAQVTMDRAFDLPAPPETVWPWLAQLGKNRAGWYLPASIERAIPTRRRALRRIEPTLQHLAPGDVIDDWGGRDATFTIVERTPSTTLVQRSERGALRISWAILVHPTDAGSRIHLRFRIAGVRRVWLVHTGGELMDLLTVAGLAAGLRERVTGPAPPGR